MKEQLNTAFGNIKAFWTSQDKKKKILMISILGAIVLIAVIVTVILNVKHYVVLYEGVESTEASEMITLIHEMGIEATYTSGGKITVPEDQENYLRMQLGTKGYPKSAINYDIWKNSVDMFTTDRDKREIAKMQLETRLIATIETLDNIEDAIVTLDIPEQKDTVINVNPKPSKASVTLRLKKDAFLKDEQISGIRHIVLTSVSGLTEDNISITDSTGKLLVEGSAPEDTVTAERDKLKFKKEYEDGVKYAIIELLRGAYGDDGFSVAVNAKLNSDKQVSEYTGYTPSHDDGSGMIQHIDDENSSGTNGTMGGIVGVEPNADDTYPTGVEGETGAYSHTKSSTSYLVNTLKQQTEKNGYYIEGLTVSVVIYSQLVGDTERTEVQSVVAGAAGVDPLAVSIANIPRLEDKIPEFTGTYPLGLQRQQFILILSGLLVLIMIVTILYIIVARAAKRKRRYIERQIYQAAQAAGERGQINGFFGTNGDPDEVASLVEAATVETKEAAVRREIGEFAQSNPEVVAQLLKSWIREENDNHGGRNTRK